MFRWAALLSVVLSSAAPFGVHAQPPNGPVINQVEIENGAALSSFFEALRARDRGEPHPLRILHYGDSNVAAGLWTQATRDVLQARFGNGGAGFLVPLPFGTLPLGLPYVQGGTTWSGRRHGDVRRFGSPDGLWGLAGVAADGVGTGHRIHLDVPPGEAQTVEVHLLGWPRGGTAEVALGDGAATTINTARPRATVLVHRIPITSAGGRISIRVRSWRPVRVLGISLENDAPGLVYDGLGINGLRFNATLVWNRALWREHMAQRNPALVIVGYGGNETLDPHLPVERYAEQLHRGLARLRRVARDVPCLVVAPVAMCDRPKIEEVIELQRRLAPRYGCAFWNTSQVSGGPTSLCAWRRHGMVSTDGLHLSPEGYRVVGQEFARALTSQL